VNIGGYNSFVVIAVFLKLAANTVIPNMNRINDEGSGALIVALLPENCRPLVEVFQ